jgi:PAS domain S-box-containing protein
MAEHRMLLVDKNANSSRAIRRVLEEKGYQVTGARNGDEALGLIERRDFEVCVTDIATGDVNGFEILRRVKEQSPATAVIIRAERAEACVLKKALRFGADDYVLVPYDAESLVMSVRRCLDKVKRKRREKQAPETKRKAKKVPPEQAFDDYDHLYRRAIEAEGSVPYRKYYSDNRFDYVGEGILGLTGYSSEDFSYEIWKSLILACVPTGVVGDLPYNRALQMQRNFRDTIWKADYRIKTRDGEEKWLANSSVNIVDEQGMVVGSLGTLQDITEQKRAEETLQQSEARYRELANSISDIYFAMDQELKYTYWNKASEKITGIRAEEAIGKSLFEMFPGAKGTIIEKSYREVVRRKKTKRFVAPFQLNNTFYIFKITAYASKDGCSVIAKDITDRKEIEESLKVGEKLLRKIIDMIPHYIFAKDSENRFIIANKATANALGTTAEEIIGKTDADFFSPEDAEYFRSQDQRVLKFNEPLFIPEEQLSGPGGVPYYVQINKIPFRMPNKKTNAILGVVLDITERKLAEKRDREYQEQLTQADRLASLGVLLAGMAHEINNPNHTIMSNIDLITRSWKSIEPILEEYYSANGDFIVGGLSYTEMRGLMPNYLNGMAEGARKINGIVNDLKDFSRRDVQGRQASVDINQMVSSAVKLSTNLIRKTTSRFHTTYGRNMPEIKGNMQRLEQVIINLIQNACQALRKKDEAIYVETKYDRDLKLICIVVQDEGVGISEQDLYYVKDPFFTRRREEGGTGLGLYVSDSIIKNHGGILEFHSVEGRGTTATVKLPIKKSDAIGSGR